MQTVCLTNKSEAMIHSLSGEMDMALNSRELESYLSHKRLRELLHYDPDTGIFTWLVRTSSRTPAGSQAGCISDKRGKRYLVIGIGRRLYHAHRLAWFYMTHEWIDEVDHIKGNGLDNRWVNLRAATHREGSFNTKRRADNKSGVKGIAYYPDHAKPYQVWLNRKYLASFASLEEAKQFREQTARVVHGEFYREE